MTSANHLSLSLVDSLHSHLVVTTCDKAGRWRDVAQGYEHCLLTNLEPPPRKDLHTNTKPHRVHALLGKSPHPWPPAKALPNLR
jgi:hypothetical protein